MIKDNGICRSRHNAIANKLLFWLVFLVLVPSNAAAQIIPDSSLGTENSRIESNNNRDTINGGALRNKNLFHSFQEFNVGTGREAYFTNPNGIDNIFTRVTGNNISNIQGVLGVFGNANLFLINPNGILFGENARLDVNGSFFAISADSVVFGNGFEFSAANPNQPPLLAIDIPIGLKFRDNPGDITLVNTQESLRVNSNSTIGLVGGNIIFEDGNIETPGGRVELGSIAEGEVKFVEAANGFTFDYDLVENFADISLSGNSLIIASGEGGGNIQVAGKNISLTGLSGFISNTFGAKYGGDINILAKDSLTIEGRENDTNSVSLISNRVLPDATADGGDINIKTGKLILRDRALITTFVFGQGNAGNININASESISLNSQGSISAIISSIGNGAVGNGGDININTSSLNIINGAFLSANISGQGNAGNIFINATESIFLDGQGTGFFTNVRTAETVGNAGDINLNTSSLTVSDGAFLSARTGGQGNAGNVELNASSINFDNRARLFTSNIGLGKGGNVTINATNDVSFANNSAIDITGDEGGSININAKNLSLTSGSVLFGGISSDSGFPEAKSGDITINLTEDLLINSINPENNAFIANISFGNGNPGNININARNITFKNGGNLSSFFLEEQTNIKIGDISLDASGNIIFDGSNNSTRSGILNSLPENISGSIGEINLNAQNLTLTNGASIQSLVAGIADSGDINIDVADSIIIDGFVEVSTPNSMGVLASDISSIIAENGKGNTGNINIQTQNLILSRNGLITNSIQGKGNAGNINIDAEQISISEPGNINLSPSRISTTSIEDGKDGGDITINTGSLFIRDGGDISANAVDGFGNGGDITINARDTVFLEGTGTVFSRKEQKNVEVSSSILAKVSQGSGNGGNININTSQLAINNNAFVSANVENSTGNGGDITIAATNSINLVKDSQISSDVINSTGNGGDITITATDSINLSEKSFIAADVNPSSTGNSGNLTIETGKLSVSGGSQIGASTFGKGNAGTLEITARDSIELSGINRARSGLFAVALEEDGNSGELRVFTQDLIIRDGAIINVGNFPSIEGLAKPGTGEPGNLTIEASNIFLENDAKINAAAQSPTGEGANITLKVTKDIILRDNSLISAQALKDATGGNLKIDARYIIAYPSQPNGNDIIASAEQGKGGEIDITAEALFGIQENKANPGNRTSDIDASSEAGLSGTVNIRQPDVNPASGLVELTQDVVNASELIAQNVCAQTVNSEFINIGKGGLPPNPDEMLTEENIEVGLVAPVTGEVEVVSAQGLRPSNLRPVNRKPPAQGWIWHEDGTVELVAYNPNQVGEQRMWKSHQGCL